MENDRLEVAIGEFTFKAEGETEVVERRFGMFREMVAMALSASKPTPQTQATREQEQLPPPSPAALEVALDKITENTGRIVELSVAPSAPDDGVLIIMLGQKIYRNNDAVTGMEVMQGMTRAFGNRVPRVDRLLDKAAVAGTVHITGEHRGRRYRLTAPGLAKAKEVATSLAATLA